MKKFKKLYAKLSENTDTTISNYADGWDKRRVDGDSVGAFRVGEENNISRINAVINKYLAGSYLAGDYKYVLRELRVRLNHIGLDFNSEQELMFGENKLKAKLFGNTFGTTPTTDLSKGFNTGDDLPTLTLTINYTQDSYSNMCYLSGKISLDSSPIKESILNLAKSAAAGGGIKDVAKGAVGAAAGAAGGAVGRSVGAAIGTAVLPGIGTAIGGMLGGLVGDKVASSAVGEDGVVPKETTPRQKRINHAKEILSKKKI